MFGGLRRNWWLAGAALIGGLELMLAVGIWVDKLIRDTVLVNGQEIPLPGEPLLVWGDIALTGLLALAAGITFAGLYLRHSRPQRSRWLIAIGLLPAVAIGAVFFWFPPFWIISGSAIAVIVRISTAGMRKELLPT